MIKLDESEIYESSIKALKSKKWHIRKSIYNFLYFEKL